MSAVDYLPYVEATIVFLLLMAYAYYRQGVPAWIFTFTGIFLVYMLVRVFLMLQGDQRFLFMQAINTIGALVIFFVYYVR